MAGIAQKFKNMWNPPEDEYDYEENETTAADEAPVEDSNDIYSNSYSENTYTENTTSDYSSSYEAPKENVVNFKGNQSGELQVVLFKPMDYAEDTTEIADELCRGNTVVLNLEITPKDVSRRVLDFLGGVAYARKGKVRRVSTSTYIITPSNVSFITTDEETAEGEEL